MEKKAIINSQFDPAMFLALKQLGASVECNGDSCTITGPGGVKATTSAKGLKDARDSLVLMGAFASKVTGTAKMFGTAKDALLTTAENFGRGLVGLAKTLGMPLVADLLGSNKAFNSSVTARIDEAQRGKI